jgi:hypothetical protein
LFSLRVERKDFERKQIPGLLIGKISRFAMTHYPSKFQPYAMFFSPN